jgi:hypothetical protein
LITADRLNSANGATEFFTNYPTDLLPISASFGGFTYNWLLDYNDESTVGVLNSFVRLNFISRVAEAVPEVSSFLLVGLVGGLTLGFSQWCGLRRRRTN